MSTTFKWTIHNIETIKTHGSFTNVVKNAMWQCEGVDENGAYGTHYGNQQLNIENLELENYASWSSLTHAQVLSWVHAELDLGAPEHDVAYIESDIQRMIDANEMPNRAIGKPWS